MRTVRALLVGHGRMGRLVDALAAEYAIEIAGRLTSRDMSSPDSWPQADVALAELRAAVRDPSASREFYATVLGTRPTLDVPGMIEFPLGPRTVLGLMPEAGITRPEDLFDDPHLNATGGLAPLIATASEFIDVVDKTLTLDGLRLVYERSRQ